MAYYRIKKGSAQIEGKRYNAKTNPIIETEMDLVGLDARKFELMPENREQREARIRKEDEEIRAKLKEERDKADLKKHSTATR